MTCTGPKRLPAPAGLMHSAISHPKMFVTDRGLFLPKDPIYYQVLVNCLGGTNLGRCSTSPAQAQTWPQSFETLPFHFIPWHPLPTQQSLRYLRCSSFLSCRVACSPAPITTPLGFFSWGTPPPCLPSRSRRRHVPFTPRSWPRHHSGHVPRPGPAWVT